MTNPYKDERGWWWFDESFLAEGPYVLEEQAKEDLDYYIATSLACHRDSAIPRLASPRGLLLYQDMALDHFGGKIVTVENYMKWYDVIIIDGVANRVTVASEEFPDIWYKMESFMPKGKSFHGDHCWHPGGIQIFAHKIGAVVDPQALGELTLRWLSYHDQELISL